MPDSEEPISVFISYAHEPDEPERSRHAGRVLKLANKLREEGFDADLDQYHNSPPGGWPLWMMNGVAESDYVIVVGSRAYLDRTNRNVRRGHGRGVKWESHLLLQDLHDADSLNERFVPVLFDGLDPGEAVPPPLRGSTIAFFDSDEPDGEGWQTILRWLTKTPPAKRPPIGTRRPLETKSADPAFFTPAPTPDLPPNNLFFGRDAELTDLHARLTDPANDKQLVVQALTGAGGVGKTELVREYVRRHGPDWSAGVAWVDASDDALNSAAEREARRLAEAAGRSLPDGLTPEQVRNVLRATLADGPSLLILDNVDDLKILPDWRFAPPTRVVATTCRTELNDQFCEGFEVGVLSRDSSIELLGSALPEDRWDDACADLDALAEHLGDHALACTLARAQLRKRRTDPRAAADLLGRLEGEEMNAESVLGRMDAEAQANYPRSLIECLLLNTADLSDGASRVLDVASACHPDRIPRAMLAAAAGLEGHAGADAIDELLGLSLLLPEKADAKTGEALVRIHRLTAAARLAAIAKDGDRRTRVVCAVLLAAAAPFTNEALEDPSVWPMLDLRLPHAWQALADEDRVEKAGAPAALAANQVAFFTKERGRLDDALRGYSLSERLSRAIEGDDHPNVAACLNNIGMVLRAKGELDRALSRYEEAERIARAASGDDHPNVATCVNSIGGVLRAKGDLDGALLRFEEAERIDRAAFGDDHPLVAIRVNNIGGVLRAKGDLDGALSRHEEAERIDRAAFGDDHPEVAIDVNNLGCVLHSKGDLDGALSRFEEAERIDRAALGDNHANVAIRVDNIGSLLRAKGDRDGALARFREAFPILIRTLGPRGEHTVVSAANLASLGVDPIPLARELVGDDAAAELERALDERFGRKWRDACGRK